MARAAGRSRTALHGGHGPVHLALLLGVGAVCSAVCVIAYLSGAFGGFETETLSMRFGLRGVTKPHELLVVGIDERTLDEPGLSWPFRRRLHAQVIETLHKEGAKTIVYDVQFSQPSEEAEDEALYQAIRRAGNVVLATTEITVPHGGTRGGIPHVLWGPPELAEAHAQAADAGLFTDSGGVLDHYPYSVGGVKSISVLAAESYSGSTVAPSEFHNGSAWIDYPGPVHTIPRVSFTEVLHGKVPLHDVAGKIVIVGATATVLQDLHRTPVTANNLMPGPEVMADAIWTALRGNPLHEAPSWITLLTIVLAAIATPLSCLTIRPGRALLMGIVFAATYLLFAQVAFDKNLILRVVYPLAALAVGTVGALLVSYLTETWERQLADRYGAALEETVRARTAELVDTQVEVINRLAQAAELRDEDTGGHIDRVGRICERVALEVGMSAEDAERLRIASTLHDVGKIGIPDRVLLKRGELDGEEWEQMKAHTLAGAQLLSGSRSPLLQMAEVIARTHHERWDGSGYPAGLRGDQIPLVGRICAICDVFDALSSEREYKPAWPRERVIEEVKRKRGTHFDPAIVDAFLKVIAQFPTEQPPSRTSLRAEGLAV